MKKSESKAPLVSVIMTVYNGERTLQQALDSVRCQTLPDFELIVVDDGSNDSTPEILAQAISDPRISVITKPRIGRARALNIAWQRASGEYIANLDADDMAEPARLEKQLAFLQSNPGVGLVGTAVRILDEGAEISRMERNPLENCELKRSLVRRNPFVHSSVIMPRLVLEAVGGYSERYVKCIDYELWIRIARSYSVANMPDVLTVKRIHNRAYFRTHLSAWHKQWAHLRIRWRAWWTFSHSITDLQYVFREPVIYFWNQVLSIKSKRHSRQLERLGDGR